MKKGFNIVDYSDWLLTFSSCGRDTCSDDEDDEEHKDFDAELEESLLGYDADGSEIESILWAFLRAGALSLLFIENSVRPFRSIRTKKITFD